MRIMIVGAGDLGFRLAIDLAGADDVREVILVGPRAAKASERAFIGSRSAGDNVRAITADALDRPRFGEVLKSLRPDLLVQCASLLSPWALPAARGEKATCIRAAGFAAQLPAQLPVLLSVMRAVRETGQDLPVVNCSYPDATHPILAKLGLAPLVGVGNAGMIAASVRAKLRPPSAELVRVLGHHAQVMDAMRAKAPIESSDGPRVYLGEDGRRADDLAFSGPPLDCTRELNAITAVHAGAIVRALLRGAAPLRTSAPGPQGLPGGYPVRIAEGRVELDLPPTLTLSEAVRLQTRWARLDGIENIADDGTTTFTNAARASLHAIDPSLALPLRPDDALRRFRLLEPHVRTGGKD